MFIFCSLKRKNLSFSYDLTRAAKPVLVAPTSLQVGKCPLGTPKENCRCAEALQKSKDYRTGHSWSWAANSTGRRRQHTFEMPTLGTLSLCRGQEEMGAFRE